MLRGVHLPSRLLLINLNRGRIPFRGLSRWATPRENPFLKDSAAPAAKYTALHKVEEVIPPPPPVQISKAALKRIKMKPWQSLLMVWIFVVCSIWWVVPFNELVVPGSMTGKDGIGSTLNRWGLNEMFRSRTRLIDLQMKLEMLEREKERLAREERKAKREARMARPAGTEEDDGSAQDDTDAEQSAPAAAL